MDSSTTVSALIGGWFRHVANAVNEGRVELICSPDLLAELSDVLNRPRIRQLLSAEDSEQVLQLLAQAATFYDPNEAPGICRDPNDDYLLALATASSADCLVTRDEDLLSLRAHGMTRIMYPAVFLQELAGSA